MSRLSKSIGIGLLLIFLGFFAWYFFSRLQDEDLHIHLFATDEGDAFLIETPDGLFITGDGGINRMAIHKFFQEKWFWDRRIDLLILTHPDSDHLNGAYALLEDFDVGQILFTNVPKEGEVYTKFKEEKEKRRIPAIIANQWSDFKSGDMTIDVLYPFTTLENTSLEEEKSNNTSIVFQLRYNHFEMLFTGDIEKEKEALLLSSGIPLRSDVLKIAHHGSATSSTLPFLQSVQPKVGLFSVGEKTRFAHPHPTIEARFQNLSIPTWNTKNGDIEIVVSEDEFCLFQNSEAHCFPSDE